MNKKIIITSTVGWIVGGTLGGLVVAGVTPVSLLGNASTPVQAESAAQGHFTDSDAMGHATSAAADYLAATLGQAQANGDGSATGAVAGEDGPITLADMDSVGLKYFSATQRAVTSISSGVSFEAPKNFWVASWERGAVSNVTTGKADGTAYVVVVIEDGTGKLLAADSGIRQPEEQARARGPLPSYEELFGAVS
jgi:hypothetical protein